MSVMLKKNVITLLRMPYKKKKRKLISRSICELVLSKYIQHARIEVDNLRREHSFYAEELTYLNFTTIVLLPMFRIRTRYRNTYVSDYGNTQPLSD